MSGSENAEHDLEHDAEQYLGSGGERKQDGSEGGYPDPSGRGTQGRYQNQGDQDPAFNPGSGGVPGYGDTPAGNEGGTSTHDPSQQDPSASSYDAEDYGTNQDQGSAGGYDAEQQGGYDPDQRGGDQNQ